MWLLYNWYVLETYHTLRCEYWCKSWNIGRLSDLFQSKIIIKLIQYLQLQAVLKKIYCGLTTKLLPIMENSPMRQIWSFSMQTLATPSSPAVMFPRSPACLKRATGLCITKMSAQQSTHTFFKQSADIYRFVNSISPLVSQLFIPWNLSWINGYYPDEPFSFWKQETKSKWDLQKASCS